MINKGIKMKKIIQDNIQTIIISAVTTIITTIATIFISFWVYNLQEESKLIDKQEKFCIEIMNLRDEIASLESELRTDCEKPSKKCNDTKQLYIKKANTFNKMANEAVMVFGIDVLASISTLQLNSLQTYFDPNIEKTDATFKQLTDMCIKKVRRTSRLLH